MSKGKHSSMNTNVKNMNYGGVTIIVSPSAPSAGLVVKKPTNWTRVTLAEPDPYEPIADELGKLVQRMRCVEAGEEVTEEGLVVERYKHKMTGEFAAKVRKIAQAGDTADVFLTQVDVDFMISELPDHFVSIGDHGWRLQCEGLDQDFSIFSHRKPLIELVKWVEYQVKRRECIDDNKAVALMEGEL